MTELALWWCGDDTIVVIGRYFLVALVWLAALFFNRRKRSLVLYGCLWLYGLAALMLAAAPALLHVYNKVPTAGITGFVNAILALIGFFAGLVYFVLLAWTIGSTFLRKKQHSTTDSQH